MNKTELLALLAANDIPADETMTVAALKELAEANGLSTAKPKPPAGGTDGITPPDGEVLPVLPPTKPAKAPAITPADDYYDGMRQAKVAAGLSLADAIEVTARQRAEDEANKVKIPG